MKSIKHINLISLCAILIIISGSDHCFGKFYKYINKDGVTSYTDNLADVPENQRPKIKTYDEVIEKKNKIEDKKNTDKKNKDKKKNLLKDFDDISQNLIDAKDLKQRLKNEKQRLDTIYKELSNEKKLLESMSQDQENYLMLKQKAEDLNSRIKKYEKQRAIFIEKLDEYKLLIQKY